MSPGVLLTALVGWGGWEEDLTNTVLPSAALMVHQGNRCTDVVATARHSVPCLRAPSPARMKEISLESTM